MTVIKHKYTQHPDGRKEWRKGDKKHRLRGPAVICPNGGQEWWLDGKKHRDDGPAVMYKCGYTTWYKHGEVHCLSGPARLNVCHHFTHTNGVCVGPSDAKCPGVGWFIHGQSVSEDTYHRLVDIEHQELLVPVGRKLSEYT